MVENCEHSASTASKNICCAITGEGEMSAYKPSFHGVMVCVGGRYGVARVGLPNLMFNLPSFLAMLSKHFINIIYFLQVLGWNKVFSYMKHEFFTIRNCRSFVGGHFSNRTPSFLLVPLRVWLGALWVFEGIIKILDGWFISPKLSGFFGSANSWYENILKEPVGRVSRASEGGKAIVEAVTSATGTEPEVAKAVGTAILNFDFIGLVRFIFVSGRNPAESTINDFAFRLDVPIMNWFVNNVIISNNSMQIFMQVFIVVAEILIGLALVGGLFTTPAAAFSLVLQFMFICTTGLYLGTFWMVFAAVALLIASGRIFGLDYYVIPFLKKQWRRLPLVRRLYIYND
jgi:NADH dehydrogenase